MVRFYNYDEVIGSTPKRLTFETAEQRKVSPLQNVKNALIKEIAKTALAELVVGLIFAGIACLFVATPFGMATLLIAAVAAVALSIIFRSINAYCSYKMFLLQNPSTQKETDKRSLFSMIGGFFNALALLPFTSLVDSKTRDLLVHEAGHAIAANALIKNPNTRISIVPFEGGQTTYRLGKLSTLGEFFGRENSKVIIAAAGPALAVATATASFAIGSAIDKSNPELSRSMKISGIDSIARHVFYAFSAIKETVKSKANDFSVIWSRGIHPIVSAITMLVIPILVKIGFYIYDKVTESRKAKELALEKKKDQPHYLLKLNPISQEEMEAHINDRLEQQSW